MGHMAHAVLWNALLGERQEAESLMAAWFLDSATRMNPHFEHAQAIPNKNMGRGTGLIEARSLLHAAQGIAILDQSGPWQGRADVMAWFGKFTDWMTGSKIGREERDSGNNHATWWTAQVAAYSLLTGDIATQQFAIKHFHDVLLRQIAADGSCPKEMARTKSFSYGVFNLEAFSILARAAASNADLWTEPKLRKAFEFLYPYVSDPGAWKGQQITKASSDRCYPYGLAGLGFKDTRFSALYLKMDKSAGPLEAVFHLLILGAE